MFFPVGGKRCCIAYIVSKWIPNLTGIEGKAIAKVYKPCVYWVCVWHEYGLICCIINVNTLYRVTPRQEVEMGSNYQLPSCMGRGSHTFPTSLLMLKLTDQAAQLKQLPTFPLQTGVKN